MATPAQLAANQRNAQKSTGPRSVEGKSVSRFNALQHGVDAQLPIIPGEDPAEYQALVTEYQNRFQASTPDERYHIQTMIDSDWQKRRLTRLETDIYRILETENPGISLAAALLTASPAAKLLARTQRQLAAHQRAWYRAFTEFRLQRERNADLGNPAKATEGNEPNPPEPHATTPIKMPERTQSPAPQSAVIWPGEDPITGRTPYFKG